VAVFVEWSEREEVLSIVQDQVSIAHDSVSR
jgi:hypothetical protein